MFGNMAGVAPAESQLNGKQEESEMGKLSATEREELFESYRSTLDGIEHFYHDRPSEEEKFSELCYLYPYLTHKPTVIIVNSWKMLAVLTRKLNIRGHKFVALGQNKNQKMRETILQNSKGRRVVITTDNVVCDIEFQASIVVNYDMPTDLKKYLRRIGRNEDLGIRGVVINYAAVDKLCMLFEVQKLCKGNFKNYRAHPKFLNSFSPNDVINPRARHERERLVTSDELVKITFQEMNLKDNVLKGILEFGYDVPSEIQQRGIGLLCKGHDVFLKGFSEAQCTATYCTAILQRLGCSYPRCQALVLAHNTSLEYISGLMRSLGRYKKDLIVKAIGPTLSVVEGAHVVVGTPEDVSSKLQKKYLTDLQMFVLHDADKLVSSSEPYFGKISMLLPVGVQVCTYSAIMSPDTQGLACKFMRKPIRKPCKVVVEQGKLALEGFKHLFVNVEEIDVNVEEEEEQKFSALLKLLETLDVRTSQCLIFPNFCSTSEMIVERVKLQDKFKFIHMLPKGDSIVQECHYGAVLVTGGPLESDRKFEASHVINFDLPCRPETYLRRVCPVGRKGTAVINFVTRHDWWNLLICRQPYDNIDFIELATDFTPRRRPKDG